MARPKEPQVFACGEDFGSDAAWAPFFQHYRGEPQVGEATPGYLHLPHVPRRIATTFPDAKIIMTLRDPVERAYSDWWMHHARGDDRADFDQAMRICVEGSDRQSRDDHELSWGEHLDSAGSGQIRARPYLEIGRYAEHLARYREFLPDAHIKVMLFDDLRRSPRGAYREVCEFLGVDAAATVDETASNDVHSVMLGRARRLRHSGFGQAAARLIPGSALSAVRELLVARGGSRPPMPDATRNWLAAYYGPHNERLARVIGRDLSSWQC